jgi:hypothetical protein
MLWQWDHLSTGVTDHLGQHSKIPISSNKDNNKNFFSKNNSTQERKREREKGRKEGKGRKKGRKERKKEKVSDEL